MANYINPTQLNTTTDNFSQAHEAECQKKINYKYSVSESDVREIGSFNAFIMGMIRGLSTKKGFCYLSNKKFAERLGMSVPTIERSLKELDDRNLIYRNSYHTKFGVKRFIVTNDHYLPYFQEFLNTPSVPEEVREKYLNKTGLFGIIKPQNPTIKDLPLKSDGTPLPSKMREAYATIKSEGCLLLRRTEGERRAAMENEAAVSSLSVLSELEEAKELPAAAILFLESFEKELHVANVDRGDVKAAMLYYICNRSLIDAKTYPMRYLMGGLSKGWLLSNAKTLQGSKQNIQKKQQQQNSSHQSNLNDAEKAREALREHTRVVAVTIVKDPSDRLSYVEYGYKWKNGRKDATTVQFGEKDFAKRHSVAYRRAQQCIADHDIPVGR